MPSRNRQARCQVDRSVEHRCAFPRDWRPGSASTLAPRVNRGANQRSTDPGRMASTLPFPTQHNIGR